MEVKIKIGEGGKMPSKGTKHSAGWDLTTTGVINSNSRFIEYATENYFQIPTGYVGLVFPRSSVSKTDLILGNCVGVIDSDFRGQVTFKFKYTKFSPHSVIYKKGNRIGQIIIMPIPDIKFKQVDELTETERGTGGYGSTGK